VRLLAGVGLRAPDELHVNRYFDFQYVDAIAVFAEFLHALDYDLWLLFGIGEALFVGAFFVADELEKIRNIVGAAFVADALDPGVLLVIDVFGIKGRVIKQNLDAVGASLFQAAGGPVVKQLSQTARASCTVAGFFGGQQQAGILCAALRGRQSPLGIEQNGAGMRRQNFGNENFEFFHHGVGDFATFFLGQGFLQGAALVHGSGSDHAAFVGDFLETGKFARSEFHRS